MKAVAVMLFLHGMTSVYDRPPVQIEAAARRYAVAHGYQLWTIEPTKGDDRDEQERRARDVLKWWPEVEAIYGFSMGGYTADRIRKDFPKLKYVIVGAPGVEGDIELGDPERDHMRMPEMLSKQPVQPQPID